MEMFATILDLESRWRDLSPDEKLRAETLIGDASAMIVSLASSSGVLIDPSNEVQLINIKSVACSMVQRSMSVNDDMAGISQWSQTAGPFNGSATFANPNGDLYITSGEKKRLGMGRSRIGSVHPLIRYPGGERNVRW